MCRRQFDVMSSGCVDSERDGHRAADIVEMNKSEGILGGVQ